MKKVTNWIQKFFVLNFVINILMTTNQAIALKLVSSDKSQRFVQKAEDYSLKVNSFDSSRETELHRPSRETARLQTREGSRTGGTQRPGGERYSPGHQTSGRKALIPSTGGSTLQIPHRAARKSSGERLSCDSIATMYTVWLTCSTTSGSDNKTHTRMCLKCERDEYWTGRWCWVDGDKLDCSKCLSINKNDIEHHFRTECEKPDRADCIAQRHLCSDDCSVTEDSYSCVCRNGRRLNEDLRTCYDALQAILHVELLLSKHKSSFVTGGEHTMNEVLQVFMAKQMSFPEVTEIRVQDLHLREDLLVATLALAMNKTADRHVASRAVNAIVSLLQPVPPASDSAMGGGETSERSPMEVKINGIRVSRNTKKCEMLLLLENCSTYCELVDDHAVCKSVSKLPLSGVRFIFQSLLALSFVVVTITASIVALSLRLVLDGITETSGTIKKEKKHVGFEEGLAEELSVASYSSSSVRESWDWDIDSTL